MLSPFCDQAAGSVYAVTPSRVGSLGSSNQEDSLTVILTALILTVTPQSDHRWQVVRPYNAKLERMAMCESTKRWHIVKYTRTQTFYGGLQFTLSTWKSVGGSGFPHRNSELEQKYRAVKLIKKNHGYGDWPICGRV